MLEAAARLRESLGEGVKALGGGEERRARLSHSRFLQLVPPVSRGPRSSFREQMLQRPLSSWLKACSKPLSPPCVCLSRPRIQRGGEIDFTF